MEVMNYSDSQRNRCGIILSGGDGERLKPFIRRLLNEDLPKQYVSFGGTRSMLEQTIDRAEQLIDPECLFTVVAGSHLNYAEVCRQLETRLAHTIVLQPRNRDTGPGLLLSLAHLIRRYPNSTVAVFPSDHFVLQEDLFVDYVRQAFEAIEAHPTKIIFLGAEVSEAAADYGYILPEIESASLAMGLTIVKAFIQAPTRRMAAQVAELGALWNTGIMVFRPEVLMPLIAVSAPKLYSGFQRIFKALNTSREPATIKKIYRDMPTIDFSRDLLSLLDIHSRNQFNVLPMEGVLWSDWDAEDRALAILERLQTQDCLPGALYKEEMANGIPSLLGAGLEARP
jgi:mannose-1-phosphate guanylyltransferase